MFPVDTAFVQQFSNAFVFCRVQVAEAVIFQLPFQLPDTQTVCQRGIDIGALFRRQHALVFRRVLHFPQMGNTFGKLYDHAAEVIHHGQQHTANVIDLFGRDGIRVGSFKLADGRHVAHAVDQRHDRVTDAFAQHLLGNHFGVGQREQHGGKQSVDIHAQHGEDFHHLHAAPKQQLGIRMPRGGAQTISPGFG